MKKEYYIIRNKYLALSMSYLGFKFMKFGTGEDVTYSFENTDQLKYAMNKMIELKKELNIKY